MTTLPQRSRATVLVVEDRAEVREVIARTLIESGYDVLMAPDGEAGLALAIDRAPDLLILDVGLPKATGLDVARQLRERGFRAPVLMLTARVAVDDRVAGLDAGADDYLAKPFDVNELVARVHALLRRSALRDEDLVLRVGTLQLDTVSRLVSRDGDEIALTQKEYSLLEFFMRHAGHAITREQISEHVWKTEFDPSTNIVDVYVNYLRKKIEYARGPQMLQTIRGTGYMLSAE
jgi:DNA-binding response OmpR family regulator